MDSDQMKLHTAAGEGDVVKIKALVAQGWDINRTDTATRRCSWRR
jgi:hypothetical protein